MNLDNAKCVDALRFETINHIFRRWLRGVMREAFQTWGRIIVRQQLKIAEDREKFSLMRMRHDLLVGGFQKLKAFRFTCKLTRHQLGKFIRYVLKLHVRCTFEKCKHYTAAANRRHRLAEHCRRINFKVMHSTLVHAFFEWRENCLIFTGQNPICLISKTFG